MQFNAGQVLPFESLGFYCIVHCNLQKHSEAISGSLKLPLCSDEYTLEVCIVVDQRSAGKQKQSKFKYKISVALKAVVKLES